MEKILVDAISVAPGIVSNLLIVVLFLKHLDKKENTFKEIGNQYNATQLKTTKALEENTKVLSIVSDRLQIKTGGF